MTTLIRLAGLADIAGIVSVHESAFAGFFLTQLGRRFLTVFYRAFLEQSEGELLVAVSDEGRIVGLLAGVRKPAEFFATLRRRRGVSFVFAALPGLVAHPMRVGRRLLAAIRYRGDRPTPLLGYWLLSSLGVSKLAAGKGAGGMMVAHFCDDANRAGAPGVYLLTDESDNEASQRFYARHGFGVHSIHERPDGRRLLILTRSFRHD